MLGYSQLFLFPLIAAIASYSLVGQTPLPSPTLPPPYLASEFDPGFGLGIDVTRKLRLDFFTGKERTDELDAAKWKISGGASLRVKPVFHLLADNPDSDKQYALVVGAAYEFSRTAEAGITHFEHKVMLDATGRWAFKGSHLLSNRARVEFRWVDGEYRFRFRDRIMLERTLRPGKLKITPYVAAEPFWDQHYGKWNQFKFTGGGVIRLFRQTSLDVYYERSHCVTCASPQTNVLGLSLYLYIKRKK